MTRRGGPYPHIRLDYGTKFEQGHRMFELHHFGRLSIRKAARALGLSVSTGWRRYWFYMDATLPGFYGKAAGPVPPQRGTAACPNGRPWLPTLDGPRY